MMSLDYPQSLQNRQLLFGVQRDYTDVAFRMDDGGMLYFNKCFLRSASPVFHRMFESDFVERSSQVIALPGKFLPSMDFFFEHVHPDYSGRPIEDDQLEILLSLADEYMVEPVLDKCFYYIDHQLRRSETFRIFNVPHQDTGTRSADWDRVPEVTWSKLNPEQIALYLRLCRQYGFGDLYAPLLRLAAGVCFKRIRDCPTARLDDTTMTDVLRTRCLWLESCTEFQPQASPVDYSSRAKCLLMGLV